MNTEIHLCSVILNSDSLRLVFIEVTDLLLICTLELLLTWIYNFQTPRRYLVLTENIFDRLLPRDVSRPNSVVTLGDNRTQINRLLLLLIVFLFLLLLVPIAVIVISAGGLLAVPLVTRFGL